MNTRINLMSIVAGAVLCGCAVRVPAPAPGAPPPAGSPESAADTPPAGPAATSSPEPPGSSMASNARYRCDNGVELSVRFADDSAVIDAGPRGTETLLRDAGGATPNQTAYSSTGMRAEFGLGVSGREAIVRYALPPLVAHCVRE